jgi:hypothetical protein
MRSLPLALVGHPLPELDFAEQARRASRVV